MKEQEEKLTEEIHCKQSEIDERDKMIADLTQRLNCEQTDQVIYENKLKAY